MPASRAAVAASVSAIALTVALEAWAIARGTHQWLLHRVPDDAFYYLVIARHLAAGDGLTFDGLRETNGVHPLWVGLEAVLALGFSGDALIRACLLLGLFALVVGVAMVARLVARVAGWIPALFGALVVLRAPGILTRTVDGMEAAVTLLGLALLATALASYATAPRFGRGAVVGLAAVLVVLARLDMVLVLPIIPIAMYRRTHDVRSLGGFAIAVLGIGGAGATWFVLRFQHILTTAAMTKQRWVGGFIETSFGGYANAEYVVFFSETLRLTVATALDDASTAPIGGGGIITTFLRWVIMLLAGLGIGSAVVSHRVRSVPQPLSEASWALAVTALLVASKAVVDAVESPIWAQSWYSPPSRVAISLTVGVFAATGVRSILHHAGRTTAAFAAGLLLLAALPSSAAVEAFVAPREEVDAASAADQFSEAAGWVAKYGPQGHYGAYEAGVLQWELDDRVNVTNLDGLVADYDYVERAVGAGPVAQIRAARIDYLVARLNSPSRAELTCASTLWASKGTTSLANRFYLDSEHIPVVVLDVRACRDLP